MGIGEYLCLLQLQLQILNSPIPKVLWDKPSPQSTQYAEDLFRVVLGTDEGNHSVKSYYVCVCLWVRAASMLPVKELVFYDEGFLMFSDLPPQCGVVRVCRSSKVQTGHSHSGLLSKQLEELGLTENQHFNTTTNNKTSFVDCRVSVDDGSHFVTERRDGSVDQ